MTKIRRLQSAPSRRARARRAERLAHWRVILGLLLLAAVFLWGSYVGMRAFELAVANRRRQAGGGGAAAPQPRAPDTTLSSQPHHP